MDLYLATNALSGGAIKAHDPRLTLAADLTPALAGGASASAVVAAQLQSAAQLAASAIAAAAAQAAMTIRQAIQGSVAAAGSASATLGTTGGNAQLVTPALRNSTLTLLPAQGLVKWTAVDLSFNPPVLVASGNDGTISAGGVATIQHAALQAGVTYGVALFTADGYSVAGRIVAQAGG